ncbi:MAG TPA: response regulator [Rickettsiales bacterium]|nr:response regulator [Rickettsiales bacterium]
MNQQENISGKNRVLEILLIEDNPTDALLTRKTLGGIKLANNVTVAEDGDKALSILRREKPYESSPSPNVILLDLNLPKKGGIAILQELKSDEKLRHIPVIILTGSHTEADVTKTYDLYASGYIVKPINPEKFTDMIRTLMWNRTIQLFANG